MHRLARPASRLARRAAVALVLLAQVPGLASAQGGPAVRAPGAFADRALSPQILIAPTLPGRASQLFTWIGVAISRDGRSLATSGPQDSEARAMVVAGENCRAIAHQSCGNQLAVRNACIGWSMRPDGWSTLVRGETINGSAAAALEICRNRGGRVEDCTSGAICSPNRN